MKCISIRLAAMAAAGILFSAGALAYQPGDTYIAVSKTAMSITGDIQFDDFGITFANGESLAFAELVADHFMADGQEVPASVYSVETPADPELENGNKLCGNGDVTYIASWKSSSGLTALAVFTGAEPPQSDADMCASYTYDIKQ